MSLSTTPVRSCGRLLAALGLAALLVLPSVSPVAAETTEPIPNSMSALGDSISRGYNACGFLVDCVARAWSTGTDSVVQSHYTRILAKNPAISGKAFNDAKVGAAMVDLNGQAQTAVGRNVDYITILMGANNACTRTEAEMTPVTTFRGQLDQALSTLKNGLPNARVAVESVPDAGRLWSIGKSSGSARFAWSVYKICQSMLANPTSTATADVDRRARVRQRIIDYNTQLAQACTAYGARCKFDNNAVFNYPFVLNDVDTWDYFHPSIAGQKTLAQVTYAAGFGW